ncbi:MAG: ribonuclease J [Bacillota bacterium]|nr:ribonuclease J [Bacillota bacterium]
MAPNRLTLSFLGGLGEIGKNVMSIGYGGEMLVVDCGLTFPDDEMLGVDIVIPDVSYLVQNRDRIAGLVLTHGHEDHTGALPYVLPQLGAFPVYGSKLALGLAGAKLAESGHEVKAELKPVVAGDRVKVGPFEVEFFRVNHSIPDSMGLAIHTPVGLVLHTGDFKFDQTPVDGEVTDFGRLAEYGRQGVLVLLSDSTHADRAGYTPSEKVVGAQLDRIFREAAGRILVTTFASNVHRIQQALSSAARDKRKVGVVGRSMVNTIDIASRLGYLEVEPGVLVGLDEALRLPDRQCLLMASGSQGEPMSALTRIARHEHPRVEIRPNDLVVLAATPVPGNEKTVARTVDDLYRSGARVVHPPLQEVHVSGHASQEELKMMINLTRPQYFVPIHGDYRNLVRHAELATELGVPKDRTFVVENGAVLEFSSYHGRIAGKVDSGSVFVDGRGVGDVGSAVMRDRTQLSQEGIVVIALTVDQAAGRVVAGPEIVTRGFVYVRESEELLNQLKGRVSAAVQELEGDLLDWPALKSKLRDTANGFLVERTGRHPMIMPLIMFSHDLANM